MSKGMLTKVMKYTLRYIGGCGDFHEMQAILWELQKQTRAVLNKTIQIAFEWDYRSREAFRINGKYLDENTVLGCNLEKHIRHRMGEDYPEFARGNLSATLRIAYKKFSDCKPDVRKGNST